MYLAVVPGVAGGGGSIMSDPGASDHPEPTRSDYDRLIALLRSWHGDQAQEAVATFHRLDKELHGINVKLDQMQQAANDRFGQMQQVTSDRFDLVQQATASSFNIMQRVFIGAALLTIGCIGYLFVATNQMSVALGQVDRRFHVVDMRFAAVTERFNGVDRRLDAMDKHFDGIDRRLDAMDRRFDGIDKRLDAMEGRFDERFEGVDRRLDTIIGLFGQLQPIKQRGIVEKQ